jgi:mono/diheme cytochrome c family protein
VTAVALTVAVLAVFALASCGSSPSAASERGQDEIVHFGCGACHTIGGIRGADADVGPRLTNFTRKQFVGGLPFSRANAVRFIMHPRATFPQGEMPDLGVTRSQAEAITTYLYGQ